MKKKHTKGVFDAKINLKTEKKMVTTHDQLGLLVLERNGKVQFFWRAAGPSMPGIFSVESRDGKNFNKTFSFVSLSDAQGTKVSLETDVTLRASRIGTKTLLSISRPRKTVQFIEISRGGSWKIIAEPSLFTGATVIVKIATKKEGRDSFLAFSSRGNRSIYQAHSTGNLDRWRELDDVLRTRRKSFDAFALTPLFTEQLPHGIVLVYSAQDETGRTSLGAALFDRDKPGILLWRSPLPLWQATDELSAGLRILGGLNIGKYFYLYIQSETRGIECIPIARYWEAIRKDQPEPKDYVLPPRKRGIQIVLERASTNPVIEPIARNTWEAFATFNPAAVALDDEKIHLLYRAQGHDGVSVLGYAASSDGIRIDERDTEPAFIPSKAFDPREKVLEESEYAYASAGGIGGCEDPRLVAIGETIYLMFVAFDGSNPPGVGLSSISKTDFLAKRWRWTTPRLISRPGQIQKNWVLFPEKIRGKYAILHGLSPEIKIEYLDRLDHLGKRKNTFIESLSSHGGRGYIEAARLGAWDNIVRGAGPPPLRTERGWLVFYHGMDMRDPGKYKLGVMLLDLEHPDQILRRALEPVLEPKARYENEGHKRGVIYVCGAVIKGKKLFIYYGASDRSTAVATADLDTFLNDLMKEKPPTLAKMNIRKRS